MSFFAPGETGCAELASVGTLQIADIRELVAEARRLQTPELALHTWGDPKSIQGRASPTFEFFRNGTFIDLRYAPAIKHPRRLEHLRVLLLLPKKTAEATVKGWFGPPQKVEKGTWTWQEFGGYGNARARWYYGAHDTASTRLVWMWWLDAEGIARLLLEFDPRP